MMQVRYIFLLFIFLFIAGLNSTVTFTSPEGGDVWILGQTQSIVWTQVTSADNPNDDYLSVRLYQVFPNGTVTTDFEYLIQDAVPDTVTVNPAGWSVTLDPTRGLNSSVSNSYILALYLETTTNVLAQSEVFTINNTTVSAHSSSTSTTSSSSSASSSSTSSTASTLATSASPPSTKTGTSSTTSPTAATSSSAAAVASSISTGTKTGIGIGVAAAVIIGLALGWFIFGRQKRQNMEVPLTYIPSETDKQQMKWPPAPAPELSSYGIISQTPNPHESIHSGVSTAYAELPEESGVYNAHYR